MPLLTDDIGIAVTGERFLSRQQFVCNDAQAEEVGTLVNMAAEKAIGRKRDNQKIKLLSATNPKRAGSASFDRFELYKTAKTTDEFLAKGGRTGDLRYDEAAGFIELN